MVYTLSMSIFEYLDRFYRRVSINFSLLTTCIFYGTFEFTTQVNANVVEFIISIKTCVCTDWQS